MEYFIEDFEGVQQPAWKAEDGTLVSYWTGLSKLLIQDENGVQEIEHSIARELGYEDPFEFDTWTLEEFNQYTKADIQVDDSPLTIFRKIQKSGSKYWYASYEGSDVLDSITTDLETAKDIGIRLLYIREINLYIATY